VVVLARGKKGIPHLVACLKRTGSRTFHDPETGAYQNLGSTGWPSTNGHCTPPGGVQKGSALLFINVQKTVKDFLTREQSIPLTLQSHTKA